MGNIKRKNYFIYSKYMQIKRLLSRSGPWSTGAHQHHCVRRGVVNVHTQTHKNESLQEGRLCFTLLANVRFPSRRAAVRSSKRDDTCRLNTLRLRPFRAPVTYDPAGKRGDMVRMLGVPFLPPRLPRHAVNEGLIFPATSATLQTR